MNALRRRLTPKTRDLQQRTPGAASPSGQPVTEHKFRTKTHRCTLAPCFNETFVAEGVLGSFLSGPLIVKVLDYDAISFDDNLGMLELSLEALREQDQLELTKCSLSGVPHGTLSLVVSWAAVAMPRGDGPRDQQSGALSVRVVEASELVAADRNRSSDPYVVVQLAGGSASGGGLDGVLERLDDFKDDVVEATQRAQQSLEDKLDSVATAIASTARPQVPMERVDAPTPEGLWFSPRGGWQSTPTPDATTAAAWEAPPPLLMPTAAEAPALFDEEGALGELRIEVRAPATRDTPQTHSSSLPTNMASSVSSAPAVTGAAGRGAHGQGRPRPWARGPARRLRPVCHPIG